MAHITKSASNSSIADLLRRMGSELAGVVDDSTRAEKLADYLWQLALNKRVDLPSGESICLNDALWVNVIFRIIERMEGKPLQPVSSDLGVTLVRSDRFSTGSPSLEELEAAASELRVATPEDVEAERRYLVHQMNEFDRDLTNAVNATPMLLDLEADDE